MYFSHLSGYTFISPHIGERAFDGCTSLTRNLKKNRKLKIEMKQKFSQIEQRKGDVHVNLKAEKDESKLIEGRIT